MLRAINYLKIKNIRSYSISLIDWSKIKNFVDLCNMRISGEEYNKYLCHIPLYKLYCQEHYQIFYEGETNYSIPKNSYTWIPEENTCSKTKAEIPSDVILEIRHNYCTIIE